jgi:uncharacterized membrane-anchored protein
LGHCDHLRRRRLRERRRCGVDQLRQAPERDAGGHHRREQGAQEGRVEPVTLVGWAEPPSYDAKAHKLYWAKDLKFGSNTTHTLNYNIRILGRRGVLVLNAIANMDQLAIIRSETRNVLAAVEFNDGHRYTDFLPGTDRTAAYGLAGMIVGATAAKAGFFKLLWVGILAFKKVIVIGVVALGAALKRLFTRRSDASVPPLPTS